MIFAGFVSGHGKCIWTALVYDVSTLEASRSRLAPTAEIIFICCCYGQGIDDGGSNESY